jgi:alginate O-acetyltransferase complex protein AlgI
MTQNAVVHDYVFSALGGFRRADAARSLNATTCGVCGFWHGARWNYEFWGAYHAVL